jgi:predicted Holliday junction resolvase-like endonuclease
MNGTEVLTASIIRAVTETSETLANFYQTTQHYNPKDIHYVNEPLGYIEGRKFLD